MDRMSQLNVVLLGAPGAGKGTQAERIVAEYGLPHISTGDILRAAVAKGTDMGLEAKKYMEAGDLVPDEVVIGIVKDRLAEPDAAEGFLLDGFPRTIPQAERSTPCSPSAGRAITQRHRSSTCPRRSSCSASPAAACAATCGKGYHVMFDPPKAEGVCDACGGELYQRDDDNEETVRNRLEVYREQTEPLIGYYDEPGRAQRAFGGGKMPDDVSTSRSARRLGGELTRRDRPEVAGEIEKIAAAGAILADCLDAAGAEAAGRASPRQSWIGWRRSSSASTAACRRSWATAASRARSALRRTTWSSTASRQVPAGEGDI